MILSGKEIERHAMRKRGILIEPYNHEQLNPNSYNVTLHNELLTYNDPCLDMKRKNETTKIIIPDEGMWLRPGKLYLGRTVEYTETHSFVPMLEGRSSIGRIGMFIHVTAGFGDVGFKGYWTVEIAVLQPLKIYPNVEIGQLFYHTIEGDYEPYNSGKYQNNDGVQASLLWKDFEKGER